MTYSYDRTTSVLETRIDALERYARQARLFPPILKRVAEAIKTPVIAREAARIEVRVRDVEHLIRLLKSGSEESRREIRSLSAKIVKEEDKDPIYWAQEDYLGNTGLSSRLDSIQPNEDLEEILKVLTMDGGE